MPTRVYLLRHGESADPTIFHGAESDVGLSERGRLQAQRAANYLSRCSVDLVVSSAMRRAIDTATPIAEACGVPHQYEASLHERRVGMLSGTPCRRKDGVWPDTLQRWLQGDTSFAPEGAESFDDIRNRVVPIWERLMEEHRGRTLVVVVHGVVIRVLLLSILEGYSVQDWPRLGSIENAAVTELVLDDRGWRAVRMNEPLKELS